MIMAPFEIQKSECVEQAITTSITAIADIALMIEKDDDPVIDGGNKEDLNEMYRSIMAARYGISGTETSWDFTSLNDIAKTTRMASKWVLEEGGSSNLGACKNWTPMGNRETVLKNSEACVDSCVDFQNWVKDELEVYNVYEGLHQFSGNFLYLEAFLRCCVFFKNKSFQKN